MNEHTCRECRSRHATTKDLEEHARYYGHEAYITRRLRAKKSRPAFQEPGPSQEEIDATLASIASALGDPG